MEKEWRLRRELALSVGAFFVVDLGLNLGKKTMQGLGRSNGSLQGAPLSESHNVLRRILEANPVRGAMGAYQFHAGRCQVSFEAGNINLLFCSGHHYLQLLNFLW